MKHSHPRSRFQKSPLRPVANACISLGLLLAGAGFAPAALAGAGWADNVDKAGVPFKQPTFYANSPSGLQADYSPTAAPGAMRDTGTALRKFVDSLPLVDGYVTNANLLAANPVGPTGRHIPTAIKEFTSVAGAHSVSYPDADYYEIAVVEYREQLHRDLPPVVKTGNLVSGGSTLRGYVQIWTPNLPANTAKAQLFYLSGAPILDNKGQPVFAVGDGAHYLGPIIDSQSGVAVRIKFDNYLPTGHYDPVTKTRGGDSFIPTDTTVPGSGLGPNGAANPAKPTAADMYPQNRALIHMHGGDTPWISDGEPHSWITPAGETNQYKRGVTTQNVPDMADPGPGSQTYYYPNNQSARMMWYHDHSVGATRINVYAGIVSAFMLHDQTEAAMIASGALPADEIPLVFEDKAFVPKDIAIQDSKWSTDGWGKYGDLWYPHVYEANQNPNSQDGTNPAGRWDYGPWFWPVFPAPLALPTGVLGDASGVQEAYADTPLINGIAYPNLALEPKAYRFRLLNGSGQRFLNLGLYVAEPLTLAVKDGGSGYVTAPTVTITAPVGGTGAATATAVIDATGVVIGLTNISVTTPFSGNPTVSLSAAPAGGVSATAVGAANTEVPMVPAVVPAMGVAPYAVNTYDGRPGGIPDPAAIGPNIIHIGTEGGFLAQPNVIPSTPVSYQQLRRIVTVLNVLDHGLYVGPAERADFIIDFSQYAGKTLIVYNDCPAPNPGFDARVDYYTGDLDQSGSGGAPATLPGEGPNTRTIMRIQVAATQAAGVAPAAAFDPNGDGGPLATALPAAFAASQEKPIVPESWQNTAYNTSFGDNLGRIFTGSTQQPNFTFTNPGVQTITGFTVDSAGAGYSIAPTVVLTGGVDLSNLNNRAATAHAVLDTAGKRVTAVVLDNAGSGYTSAPTVALTGGDGIGASAVIKTTNTVSVHVEAKGIQELFDQNYGRMNATFSTELPYTSVLTQATIPQAYVDPPLEAIADGETQFWKITHNGVDTHPVHFHLFNVQVINRVGWDGTVVALDPAEFGWKETVKMNPLEDIYVAVRPKSPAAPFGVPQSVRALDPTQPLGAQGGFTQVDPTTGLATTVKNDMYNFDWEYVWHCHILGHEENDFMRPIVFHFGALTPDAVTSVGFDASSQTVTWIDPTPAGLPSTWGNKKNELGFLVQRSDTGANGYPALPSVIPQSAAQASGNPAGALPNVVAANATSWVDTLPPTGATTYRVVAFNPAGYSIASASAGVPGAINSFSSTVGAWNANALSYPQTNVTQTVGGFPVTLSWTSATAPKTGFSIVRSGGIDALGKATLDVVFDNVAANLRTFTDPSVPQNSTMTYKITGVSTTNGVTTSSPVSSTSVNTSWATPPAVSGMAGSSGAGNVNLSWTAPADLSYVTAYNITRTGGTGGAALFVNMQNMNPLSGTIDPPLTTYVDASAVSGTAYTYKVVAVNGTVVGTQGSSAIVTAGFTAAPAMTGATATANSATQVTVSWAAAPANSSVTSYQITRTSGGVTTTLSVPVGIATSFVDSTVAANTAYSYSIAWVNGPKVGTAASTASVTTPYAAAGNISGLSAVANAGQTAVTLNWAAASPATAYTVTRCVQTALNGYCTNAATSVFTVLSSTLTTPTYVDSTVVAGTAYTYQVIAANGPVNKSVPSSVAVANAAAAPAPAFTAVPVISAGSVSLNWVASAVPATGYAVQRSADAGVTWSTVGTTASRTATTFADASVIAGNVYQYRILATQTVGGGQLLSTPSAVQTVNYIVQAAPLMTASVFAGTAAAPTVKLNWTQTVNAGPAVTGFQVYRDGVLITTTAKGAATYTDTTVPGVHNYTVLAINVVGNSAATATTTANLLVQAAPVLATATMTSATVTAVTWTETATALTPAVTAYQIWASVNGAAAVQMGANTTATATSANVTTVAGNTYVFSVKAVNLIGSSAASNPLTVAEQVQAAPVQAAASFTSATSVTLNWAETATAGIPGVTGFNVYNGTTLLTTTPLAANVTSYAAKTVVGTSYSFTVKAVNLAGLSAASNAVTMANTVPTTVAAPTAVFVSPTSTTVSWTPATVAANAPAITGYNVYNGTTLLNATPLAATATSYTATTAVGTSYNFSVKAVNLAGLSAAGTGTTVVNTVPATPVAPTLGSAAATVAGATTDNVTINWTPVTNTAGGQPVTSYVIEYATVAGSLSLTPVSPASVTTVTVPAGGLTGAQTATISVARGTANPTAAANAALFRVIAVNAVGNSANGATLTVAKGSLK